MNKKPLILLELNEINFNFVEKYLIKHKKTLPNFTKLLSQYKKILTKSETEYHLLEPWIQWVSAHTNLEFSEHKIFRLGDIVESKYAQIFETIEKKNFKVGCVSPMNASNALSSPAYFIPDPWTNTKSSNDFWCKNVHQLLKQTVNDNSKQKISLKSYLTLICALVRFAKFKNYLIYFKLALGSFGKPWRKALFLDTLINDIHIGLLNKNKPDFSTVFFNAGAHIQHHYFHNSKLIQHSAENPKWYIEKKYDPFYEMLQIYDAIIGHYLNKKYEVIIATGLSQRPYEKPMFYYRLKNHKNFLNKLQVRYKSIYPRMTRDFLIEFENENDLLDAKSKLSKILCKDDGLPLFKELDVREKSIFVTLTYPKEISKNKRFSFADGSVLPIYDDIVFVAIKNGDHHSEGSAFVSQGIDLKNIHNTMHVKELFTLVNSYF